MPRSPHQIEVADRQKLLKMDAGRLIRVARSVLVAERVVRSEISLALVDNPQMHKLNRDFLKHDYPTDVISFLLDEDLSADSPDSRLTSRQTVERRRGAGKIVSGEVIISVEYAARMAARYGWTTADEVLLYLVHGLLHICGYDDQSDRELRIMRGREVEVLAQWKLTPRYESGEKKPRAKKLPVAK